MTAARATRARSAPRLPRPQLVDPPAPAASPITSMAARRFDLPHELIATACGRIVERQQTPLSPAAVPADATPEWLAWQARRGLTSSSENTYRLWEPVIDGNAYGVTSSAIKPGTLYGLAHTRRAPLRLRHAEAVKTEMAHQRRAMDAIVASCPELQGEHPDQPHRNCGVVRLFGSLTVVLGNVERAAREARAKR